MKSDDPKYIAEIKRRREIGEIFPDYPCAKCNKDGSSCRSLEYGHNNSCSAWMGWFSRTWRQIRRNAGKVK